MNDSAMKSAVQGWLRSVKTTFYRDGITSSWWDAGRNAWSWLVILLSNFCEQSFHLTLLLSLSVNPTFTNKCFLKTFLPYEKKTVLITVNKFVLYVE